VPGAGAIVIGVGNVLHRDDGLGVHVVRQLREAGAAPPGVELVDGGTAGLMLLPHLAGAARVVIVDAIAVGAAPGTLVRLAGDDVPAGLADGRTPHGVGLLDLLGAARLTGAWPDELVVHGAQPGSTELGTELSAPVAACLDALVGRVADELRGWGACQPLFATVRCGPGVTAASTRR
jgi:hydrogenase maturation protease